MKKIVFAFMVIFMCSNLVFASNYSLKDLLDLTEKNNPDLKILRLMKDNSSIDRKLEFNNLFPALTYSYVDSDSKTDTNPSVKTEAQIYSFKLSQSFPGLFQKPGLYDDISILQRQKAIIDFENNKNGIMYLAVNHYFSILKTVNEVKVHHENLFLINELLKVTKLNYQAGSGMYSDVLRVEAQKINIEVDLKKSENLLDNQLLELNAFIDNSLDSYYPLLKQIIVDGIKEGSEFDTNYKFDIRKFEISKILEERVKEDPALKLLEKDIKISNRLLDVARASYFPDVAVSAEKSKVDKTNSAAVIGNEYSISVVLSGTLYDQGSTGLEIKKAQNTLKMAKTNYEYKRLLTETGIKKAFKDYMEVVGRVDGAEKATEYSEENLRLVKERFEQGGAGIVELIDAQVLISNTKLSEIKTFYDERMKLAQFLLKINKVDEFGGLTDEK